MILQALLCPILVTLVLLIWTWPSPSSSKDKGLHTESGRSGMPAMEHRSLNVTEDMLLLKLVKLMWPLLLLSGVGPGRVFSDLEEL